MKFPHALSLSLSPDCLPLAQLAAFFNGQLRFVSSLSTPWIHPDCCPPTPSWISAICAHPRAHKALWIGTVYMHELLNKPFERIGHLIKYFIDSISILWLFPRTEHKCNFNLRPIQAFAQCKTHWAAQREVEILGKYKKQLQASIIPEGMGWVGERASGTLIKCCNRHSLQVRQKPWLIDALAAAAHNPWEAAVHVCVCMCVCVWCAL